MDGNRARWGLGDVGNLGDDLPEVTIFPPVQDSILFQHPVGVVLGVLLFVALYQMFTGKKK